jgi:hypothetical protein
MNDDITNKAREQGIKLAIIPIECLSDIKSDMAQLENENNLNELQKWIIRQKYILDVPELDFEAKAIVIAVW